MKENYKCNVLKERIERHPKRPLLVAIDGRCASGKTTLARQLKEVLEEGNVSCDGRNLNCDASSISRHENNAMCCNVISMDHFFLQPHQRTDERLKTPGGNVDYERVLEEVMLPLSNGQRIIYRPFDCHTQTFEEEIVLEPGDITIVEGAYACHPKLREYYDLRVFLTVDKEEQLRRIEDRNGREAVSVFKNKWIPMEEAYFKEYSVAEGCEFVL